MVFIDMDSLRFYEPPAKLGARSDRRSITSNLRILLSRWKRKDSVALGANQEPSGVPYNPNLTQSQNRTGPLQKDSLNSFSVPEIGLNGIKADREMASDPIEVDSGHDSSDDSGSDSGHEASSATTSTCAISPGVSSSNEGQMKNTKTGGKETGRLIAAALNPQEQRDSSWPDIDDFFTRTHKSELLIYRTL
ncbi:MAG: hypothetical protein LQ350_003168 [Teloschistes chrysophthalmus]|nr:MAG: hypothetical protein LQ350_003168 [Niorma chrysophthalma]